MGYKIVRTELRISKAIAATPSTSPAPYHHSEACASRRASRSASYMLF